MVKHLNNKERNKGRAPLNSQPCLILLPEEKQLQQLSVYLPRCLCSSTNLCAHKHIQGTFFYPTYYSAFIFFHLTSQTSFHVI